MSEPQIFWVDPYGKEFVFNFTYGLHSSVSQDTVVSFVGCGSGNTHVIEKSAYDKLKKILIDANIKWEKLEREFYLKNDEIKVEMLKLVETLKFAQRSLRSGTTAYTKVNEALNKFEGSEYDDKSWGNDE